MAHKERTIARALAALPPPPPRGEKRAALQGLLDDFGRLPYREQLAKRDETAAAAAELLPCNSDLPEDFDEIQACDAADAEGDCPFNTRGEPASPYTAIGSLRIGCPRDRAIAADRKQALQNEASGMPRRYLPVLRAALDHREMLPRGEGDASLDPAPPVPLLDTDAMRAARAYLRQRAQRLTLSGKRSVVEIRGTERMLVLAGTVGTGKSFAAAWILSQTGGRWYRAADLCRVRDDFDPDEAADFKGAIVVDDLGQEHAGSTDYALTTIDRILGARYDANRRTIITSNLARAALRARYGDRLDDRLDEAAIYVPLPGASLRKKAGQ